MEETMTVRVLSRFGIALAIAGFSAVGAVEPSLALAKSSQAAAPCAGVEAEAQAGSFTDWPGVSQAKRITQVHYVGKAPMHRTAGVQFFVPARAGLSAESLQRLAGCQMALAADQGGDHILAVPGSRAEVTPRGDGYRVRILGEDVSSAQELVRRMGL
jgi:hypothetical protein